MPSLFAFVIFLPRNVYEKCKVNFKVNESLNVVIAEEKNEL